ncbi:MAG: metalloprotease PmbA [Chromatiales bacterium 21-64-14]|nr:MAG: metalloprotease PmbA [Chromatiales bacterium 21-64-14]HQU14957.1 metalloprotease PmbA [Gammaproteobacteria bacterium]
MSKPLTKAVDAVPDPSELEPLVQQILDESRRQGASAAEAGVSSEIGLSVNVRLGEVETVEYHRDRGLGVTVYFGARKGSASTADLRTDTVRDTVRAACDIARYTAEDPYAGLADAARMARVIPQLDLDHPWMLNADAAIELTLACENAARELDPRITNSEGAGVNSHRGIRVYANTHGFMGGYASTRHSLSCAVIAQSEQGMQRDYWYTVARDRTELESAEAVGRRAAQRTLHRLDAKRLSTRQAPVIYAAELAGGLLGHFLSAIRGGNLYRKASFLVDHLGKPVFPSFVQIQEQPHLPKALGSAPFDSEGVETRARALVKDGVLQGYLLDSYAARKLGMETTGNAGGAHNVIIQPGDHDLDGLLREMGTGLLVTELMGHGINLLTGDYSRGAAGYWVEGGELQYPVEEITVAGNLRDIYRGLAAVGRDVDPRGNVRTGSLLIERMTIAGE